MTTTPHGGALAAPLALAGCATPAAPVPPEQRFKASSAC
jgi:hypothetical protein